MNTKRQRARRLLLVLAALLVAISSALTLHETGPRELPVYVNIAAMLAIAAVVSIKKEKTNV
ncbi:MAG: hypothetical protein LBF09_06465 [Odoribacteraceae bacterium]|jgi:peptidoglycan/LPS O-acetylase OafA/YrhL|nr:hypothetical protein [Odoribacteraceae bacterium]